MASEMSRTIPFLDFNRRLKELMNQVWPEEKFKPPHIEVRGKVFAPKSDPILYEQDDLVVKVKLSTRAANSVYLGNRVASQKKSRSQKPKKKGGKKRNKGEKRKKGEKRRKKREQKKRGEKRKKEDQSQIIHCPNPKK